MTGDYAGERQCIDRLDHVAHATGLLPGRHAAVRLHEQLLDVEAGIRRLRSVFRRRR